MYKLRFLIILNELERDVIDPGSEYYYTQSKIKMKYHELFIFNFVFNILFYFTSLTQWIIWS